MKPTLLIILPAVLLSLLSLTILSSIAPDKLLVQSIFLLIALLVAWGVWSVGVKNWLLLITPVYLGVLILLLATVLFGRITRGSTRWLELGTLRFQASELAKPVVLLFVTRLLSSPWPEKRKQQVLKLIKVLLAVTPVIIVVLLQPNLGTAIMIGVIVVMTLVFSGLPRWLMVCLVLIAVAVTPLGKVVLADYQLRRIEAFFHPYADPRGAGYQVIQSTIAVGSGMFFGRGLGQGTQSQLKFLPDQQTDFIFASLVEELGLLGGGLAMALYVSLIIGLSIAAYQTRNRDSWLVVTGVLTWLFFQSAVNIGMNLGLAPVTGITLPFLSAGGSSLVSSAIMIALAASVV